MIDIIVLNKGIYALASRTGMGKTTLALQIALNIADSRKKDVLFYSLELPKRQVRNRIDRMIMFGGELSELYSENKSRIIIDDNSELTPTIIAERIQSENNKPALVVIDYIQLMFPLSKKPFAKRSSILIASELSAISTKLNTPILVLSQLPREINGRKNKRPMLSDLKFAEKCDTVLMLYSNGYYYGAYGDNALKKTELIVAKSQKEQCGTIELNFDRKALMFKNC